MGGELFSLFAKLTLDTSEFDGKTEQAAQKAGVFGDVLKADLVGKGISAAFNGIKKLSGVIKDFATDAVQSYGEIEQLRGGVETLFGESAKKVLADADQAFKTAGMSASQYMETSIQSAASLINSLKGNQAKAADLMSMSITDMADNVNKMGTSMEAVQNAYRGFSRGNFTMLDNLALGFAGTKEGMQELLDKAQKISGIKYNISSYADMVEAIHVVQTEMGITGTTAKEAAQTISGSIGALKSAWENLIAGLADPDADLGSLIDGVVKSAETALSNVIPAVERGLSGISRAIGEIGPVLIDEIPNLISTVAPVAITAGKNLVTSLFDAAIETIPALWNILAQQFQAGIDFDKIADWASHGRNIVYSLINGILSAIPNLVKSGGRIMTELVYRLRDEAVAFTDLAMDVVEKFGKGITSAGDAISEYIEPILSDIIGIFTDNVPEFLETGAEVISKLAEGFAEGIPSLLESVLPMVENLSEAIREGSGYIVDAGINVILSLAQGIMDSLPTLLEQLPQIIINIAGVINDNAPKLIAGGIRLIQMLISGIINAVPSLIANFPQIFQAVLAVWSALNWIDLGHNVINFIKNGVQNLFNTIPNTMKDIGKKAIEFFKGVDWANAGSQAINFIKSAIMGLFTSIPNALTSIGNAAVSAFKSINWWDLGANIIRGIVNGISSNVGAIVDAAKNAAKRAFEAAKDFLGIKSPSRLFRDEVGAMIPRGLALGIDEQASTAVESADRLARRTLLPFDDMDVPTFEVQGQNPEGSNMQDILTAILTFLRDNWPEGEPIPIVIDGGGTVGYYDRQMGVRANMRRRGVT